MPLCLFLNGKFSMSIEFSDYKFYTKEIYGTTIYVNVYRCVVWYFLEKSASKFDYYHNYDKVKFEI